MIEFAFLALFIFLLIKAVLFLIRFIKEKLGNLHPGAEGSSGEEVFDIREKCDIVKNRNRSHSFAFIRLSPAERIRFYYRKRILSSRNAFPQGSETQLNRYTARESGRILEREKIAGIYEKEIGRAHG